MSEPGDTPALAPVPAEDEAGRFDGAAAARRLTTRPGVYRYLDGRGDVLYVGKARNLRNRVASYFQKGAQLSPRIRSMVAQVAGLEVMTTRTEGEALLLESNLIKQFLPRYNVVLRDDKSYPYIYLSSDQDFPRLSFHRGARKGAGRYFGPYPSAGAVRGTLNHLQKLFQLRSCEDSYFNNRTRPCLQHQINRCTAPCVGRIDAESYRADVTNAVLFLEGRSAEVIEMLGTRMEAAAAALDYERAARYRDQIVDLRRVQQRQYVSSDAGDVDVVALALRDGIACVEVLYIRNGHNLGNKSFFPAHVAQAGPEEVLAAFMSQYYLGNSERELPREILLSDPLEEAELYAQELGNRAGARVRIASGVRGERARWVQTALENAQIALAQRISATDDAGRRWAALREALGMDEDLARVECFDISHTRGEATVASCVVFGPEGAIKSDYRRFNIEGITPGDDFAAMSQALQRRYQRLEEEEAVLPDLLLIDGGKGQVRAAREVLAGLQIDSIVIVGVAKGPTRRAGLETLVLADGRNSRHLSADSPALHLIQQVRDEAHRFAITGHRQRRGKGRTQSSLETIDGVGAKRRRALLRHFGGLQGISRAGVEDLAQVPGISRALAQRIYDTLHEK